MDAGSNIIAETGSRHQRIALVTTAFFALASCASAPAQDGRIRVRDTVSGLTHTLRNEPQQFAPVQWDVQSLFSGGCLIEWQAVPFAHTGDQSFEADCELAIRLTQASPRSAGWSVTQKRDSTQLKSGRRTAAVSVTATEAGEARVEMSVQFLHSDFSRLAAGRYQTTVVGTITGL